MADDIGAQVRATPGLPEVIADLLGDGLGFSRLEDNAKAMAWALRAYRAGREWPFDAGDAIRAVRGLIANSYVGDVGELDQDDLEEIVSIVLTAARYRAGQEAAPDGPRTWALPDGAEARARIVVVVNRRRGSVHGMTADNAEAQRWTRELIDSYRDELAAIQYVGLVKVGPGSLFVDPLADAAPTETGPAPARIDGAGRTGAGAGERVDDAQDDSGGRDG